jgi:hypothetical protein
MWNGASFGCMIAPTQKHGCLKADPLSRKALDYDVAHAGCGGGEGKFQAAKLETLTNIYSF